MSSEPSKKLVLLEFYKDDCRQCQTMEPVLEKLMQRKTGMLEVVRVDADKNLSVAVLYGVRSVPAFILLKNGKVCWRQNGLLSLRELESLLQLYARD